MKCSNCNAEYTDPNQVICEFCGSELRKSEPTQIAKPLAKISQFLDDFGVKDLYQKIKKSLKG
ncbi:MAG: hypothetical protein ACFE8G_10440 [Candidatus Hermodarchaeota archaeon]